MHCKRYYFYGSSAVENSIFFFSRTMHYLKRTQATDEAFQQLVDALNQELWDRYPEVQGSYAPHNNLDAQARVVVLFAGNEPVACGAFRRHDANSVEIKRMFVRADMRGNGFSKQVLLELEKWAKEDGYTHTRLETGIRQPEAIGLYHKLGYQTIPCYGPYQSDELSICMEKILL